MKQSSLAAMFVTGLLALVTLTGCGDTKVKVSGKLLKDGQPLNVPNDTLVTLTFAPEAEEKKGQTYPARFKHESGKYEVEMPPGKYRAVYVIAPKGKSFLSASDEFKKKSYDLTRTQEIDIELNAK